MLLGDSLLAYANIFLRNASSFLSNPNLLLRLARGDISLNQLARSRRPLLRGLALKLSVLSRARQPFGSHLLLDRSLLAFRCLIDHRLLGREKPGPVSSLIHHALAASQNTLSLLKGSVPFSQV
jgi:hypothetical protein